MPLAAALLSLAARGPAAEGGRTAPGRFVFHFGLIYCEARLATLQRVSPILESARERERAAALFCATPRPTNVPHKTWYQRSSNGDLQSLQAPGVARKSSERGGQARATSTTTTTSIYIYSANTSVPNGYALGRGRVRIDATRAAEFLKVEIVRSRSSAV